MSGSYHDQFEPWWPARSVMNESDRQAGLKLYNANHVIGLSPPDYAIAYKAAIAVKVTDEAIAHAIRESHRN